MKHFWLTHRLPVTRTTGLILVAGLLPPLGAHKHAKAQGANPDEAYLRAVITVYSVGKLGGLVKAWCDERAPQSLAAHNAAHKAWRAVHALDEVDARMAALSGNKLDTFTASINKRRKDLDANLDKQFKDPAVECQKLEARLNADYNPKRSHPDEYKLVFSRPAPMAMQGGSQQQLSSSSAPAKPPEAQSAAQDAWGLLKPPHVERTLQAIGAKPPLKLGGPLKLGAYQCTQVRTYGDSARSEYRYTLALHQDLGLRIDGVVIGGGSANQPQQGRDFIGTYQYQAQGGEIRAEAWDYSNHELRGFAITQGDYKSAMHERTKVNAFRQVTDANSKTFWYGLQEFSDRSNTSCVYVGEAKRPSPVAEAKTKRTEADAQRFKFRTKPDAGLKEREIEGYWRTSRTVSESGGGLHIDEHSDLLLKDGWGYNAPDYSPHDFDAEASRKHEPLRWFRWKREGGSIVTSQDGKVWKKSSGVLGQPIKLKALNGSYKTMAAYGISPSTTATFVTRTWVFTGGKHFAYFNSNQAGLYDGKSKAEGSYTRDGYTLALTFKDGSVRRAFVYGWGSGDKNLVIDGETFSRD